MVFEANLATEAGTSELALQLVEAGVRYRCNVDLKTGTAKLSINQGDSLQPFSDGQNSPSASTALRSGAKHKVVFTNCDDQLLLWVDDELVTFDTATTFDLHAFVKETQNHPHYTQADPLDAAPVGIAVRGGKCTIDHLRVDRDKYYIATDTSMGPMQDYDYTAMRKLLGESVTLRETQALFGDPERWDEYAGVWQSRRSVSFDLDEDQFFPMGDNSAASLDARCWVGAKARGRLPERFHDDAYKFSDAAYVPRDLLVGKALIVFWPHPWKRPVPMTPNFKRFKLIR